jgi:acetoin utilization protein AcuB
MIVQDFMTKRIVTVELDDKLATVKEIFEHMKFHHLLVVEDGRLIGVISDRDLLKALSPNIGTSTESYKDTATLNKRAHQIMTRNPITLRPDALLQDAVNVFNTHSISCIPIVEGDDRPVGIVSWRDTLRVLATKRDEP